MMPLTEVQKRRLEAAAKVLREDGDADEFATLIARDLREEEIVDVNVSATEDRTVNVMDDTGNPTGKTRIEKGEAADTKLEDQVIRRGSDVFRVFLQENAKEKKQPYPYYQYLIDNYITAGRNEEDIGNILQNIKALEVWVDPNDRIAFYEAVAKKAADLGFDQEKISKIGKAAPLTKERQQERLAQAQMQAAESAAARLTADSDRLVNGIEKILSGAENHQNPRAQAQVDYLKAAKTYLMNPTEGNRKALLHAKTTCKTEGGFAERSVITDPFGNQKGAVTQKVLNDAMRAVDQQVGEIDSAATTAAKGLHVTQMQKKYPDVTQMQKKYPDKPKSKIK